MGVEKNEKRAVVSNCLKNRSQITGHINTAVVFALTVERMIVEEYMIRILNKQRESLVAFLLLARGQLFILSAEVFMKTNSHLFMQISYRIFCRRKNRRNIRVVSVINACFLQ